MTFRIAIQPDFAMAAADEPQSYSERWFALAAEAGHEARSVDMFAPDWLSRLEGFDAFMWRFSPYPQSKRLAVRLIQALEQSRQIITFPTSRDVWHFEDKVSQTYLLAAAGIPMPETVILWDRQAALAHCRTVSYPFVFKLAHGWQSSNVTLIRNYDEAAYFVDKMFSSGLVATGYRLAPPHRMAWRRVRAAWQQLRGGHPNAPTAERDLSHGFFLAQEYIPDNAGDIRITIVGKHAYGFRRGNRPNDFRASGSGLIDSDPAAIDPRAVRLAYRLVAKLGMNPAGVDMLVRDGQFLVIEVNFAFASHLLRNCPGQWVLHGDPDHGELVWQDGSLLPADAIFEYFVDRMKAGG